MGMDPEVLDILPVLENHNNALLRTVSGKEIKYLTREEVGRILSVLTGRDRLLVQMLWQTGARVSELIAIRVRNIDFQNNTITFRTLKRRRALSKQDKQLKVKVAGLTIALADDPDSKMLAKQLEKAKAELAEAKLQPPPEQYRTVPVKPELMSAIAAYVVTAGLQPNNKLFDVTRIRVHQIIQKAAKRAWLNPDRAHAHAFRHGFAVNAMLSGVPPLVLKQWMGHARLQSTMIYTDALAQDTKHYIDSMVF